MTSMVMAYISPLLSVLVGALVVLFLDLVFKEQRMRRLAAPIILLILVISIGMTLLLPQNPAHVLAALQVDALTTMVWVVLLAMAACIVILGAHPAREFTGQQAVYHAFILFSVGSSMLLVAASNIVMLFLSMDFLSIVCFVLTGFSRGDKRSTEAATKYLIYGTIVSALMLFGLSWLYGLTGAIDYTDIALSLQDLHSWILGGTLKQPVLLPVLVFLLAGLAFKISVAPFHHWAPDAYEGAPTPVATLLALIPKIAGVAAIIRITQILLPGDTPLGEIWRWPLLTLVAIFTITFGNLAGLWQDRIKRLLAYSGISQMGYILLALVASSEAGVRSALYYLAAYAVADLGIFAVLSAAIPSSSPGHLAELRGLYRKSPLMAVILIICVLSLLGIPGTGGFIGKFTVFSSLLAADQWVLAVIAGLNTLISAAYYWNVIKAVFVHPETTGELVSLHPVGTIVPVISVIAVVILGVLPNVVLPAINNAVAAIW